MTFTHYAVFDERNNLICIILYNDNSELILGIAIRNEMDVDNAHVKGIISEPDLYNNQYATVTIQINANLPLDAEDAEQDINIRLSPTTLYS